MDKKISDYIDNNIHHMYNSSIVTTTTHGLRCVTWDIVRNTVNKEISKTFTIVVESLE